MDVRQAQSGDVPESSTDWPAKLQTREITRLRGHTMKEYEEKLSQLKKENFNLKLRIYFNEERNGKHSHVDTAHGKDEVVSKYEELKNEAESTRKELNEKQELLFNAMLALNVLEEKLNEEQRQRHAEAVLYENRILQLEKDAERERRHSATSFLSSDYDYDLGTDPASEAPGVGPRPFLPTSAQVHELHTQVSKLERALRDEVAKSTRLREQLKIEKEARSRQDGELAMQLQKNEEQEALVLQLTIDLKRHRNRCADLEALLAKEENRKEAERDTQAKLAALQTELERLKQAEASEKCADGRSVSCLSLMSSQDAFSSPVKSRERTEIGDLSDATAELSRLRIDYDLALQNMARFLKRSRVQQTALEQAEKREQQLVEEVRELRAICNATKTDACSIEDRLSCSSRLSSPTKAKSSTFADADCGDHGPVLQKKRSVVRTMPSLLSWVLQSFSQMWNAMISGRSASGW